MVNLAYPIVSDQETFSVSRLNQHFIMRMTGTEFGTWDVSKPITVLITADGAGFLKGHVYSIDDEGIIHDLFKPHLHTSAQDGNSFYDIKSANAINLIDWDHSTGIGVGDFKKINKSGTGVADNDMTSNLLYTRMLTGNVANDYVSAIHGGGRISFGKPLTLQIKYGISHDIDTYMVMGMAIPEVQNASGTLAQMGFDHCSGTNNQIGVFSADGATRHIDYITNVVQSVPYGIRIDYSPSSKIVATTGSGLVVIKTSNLPPVAAASNPDNLFRAGIKSLNATQKTLRLFAVRLFGQSHDSVTGVMGWV